MSFTFSARSHSNLSSVNASLREVATRALELSDIDFAVIEGQRDIYRQAELVAAGASQTKMSKHLIGHAIDVAAIRNGEIDWSFPLYASIAAAFRLAAIELNVPIRWGGCWGVLNELTDDMEAEVEAYRIRRKGKAFIDAGHFELHFSTETTA